MFGRIKLLVYKLCSPFFGEVVTESNVLVDGVDRIFIVFDEGAEE